jgi:hypothetical protein
VGVGAKHRLVFVDRLLATLVHLHHGNTHEVPACCSAWTRSTVTGANSEVRPLLAERGCTVSPASVCGTLPESSSTSPVDATYRYTAHSQCGTAG